MLSQIRPGITDSWQHYCNPCWNGPGSIEQVASDHTGNDGCCRRITLVGWLLSGRTHVVSSRLAVVRRGLGRRACPRWYHSVRFVLDPRTVNVLLSISFRFFVFAIWEGA